MIDTLPLLSPVTFPPIQRGELSTVQMNLGYLCNQQCLHCHVNAGPNRTELMSQATMDQVLAFAEKEGVTQLDLTGGAPELNPHFRYLVERATALGMSVIDRCNLTVLFEPGQEGLAQFLADHRVEVVASMPCYLEENVDQQRGKGVYEGSIKGLKLLNSLGYGVEGTGLALNLMYNPGGAFLPPAQQELELAYKQKLSDEHGIVFNALFTLTNVPIKRFGSMLVSKGEFDEYMGLLESAFRDDNLATVMCRSLVSIDWQGYLYDCDFNQMLNLPMEQAGQPLHVSEAAQLEMKGRGIKVLNHCYACTAGQGSSCGGALSE